MHAATNQNVNIKVNIGGNAIGFDCPEDTWNAFQAIALLEKMTLEEICALVVKVKPKQCYFSKAIEVFVQAYLKALVLKEEVPG